jgi:hypothetical protein
MNKKLVSIWLHKQPTMDSGSLNCITTKADSGSLSSQFYLEVN